ncbi:GNAT family N-acetyltransferase [Longimicrobium sp.]|jgi:aminoglycoside 6'-N-acetyltransferase I|uniref:GNAT family N-acetyltransferase n=1 Tax=Longimicrobium sp. TaxID=2029185 RepID=UPI002EDA2FC7
MIELRLLGPGDAGVLARVADDVFDDAVDPRWTAEFLADRRHHMIVALDEGVVVGMISAVDYVHPDKAPQLWINEVGVAPSHQRRGIARRLMDAMLQHGRAIGCTDAWLGTEETNVAARGLYESAGSRPEPFILYAFPLQEPDTPKGE